MVSLRKYWPPAVFLIIFLFHLLLFSKPETTTSSYPKPAISWETSAYSYKDLLRFAENASRETGIRSEYLVAIFSQESSLGKNVGSCFLFNPNLFGPGIGINLHTGNFTSKIMKPERDVLPFFAIMKELDRNPYFTPISCPMEIGWGGAMGPAQILPSTWILVKDRTADTLGKRKVDPWVPEDAFMAAAIHLKDLGADRKKPSWERTAACRYFSGKPCGEYKLITVKKTRHGKTHQKLVYVENPMIAGYGNSVMKKTAYFQKLLKPWEFVQKKLNKKTKSKALSKKQPEKNVSKKHNPGKRIPIKKGNEKKHNK